MAEHGDGQAVRRACHHVMCGPVCMCFCVISEGKKILCEGGGGAWGVARLWPMGLDGRGGARRGEMARSLQEGRGYVMTFHSRPAQDLPVTSSPGLSRPGW